MVSVVLSSRSANVTVKAVSGTFVPPNSGSITIGNMGAVASPRLDNLQDVVEGSPANGDILTYNSADDKYYVIPINIDNKSLDGGTF